MDTKRLVKMIRENHKLIMDLAHIVVVNQASLDGTSKLASDLAKCHQHYVNRMNHKY